MVPIQERHLGLRLEPHLVLRIGREKGEGLILRTRTLSPVSISPGFHFPISDGSKVVAGELELNHQFNLMHWSLEDSTILIAGLQGHKVLLRMLDNTFYKFAGRRIIGNWFCRMLRNVVVGQEEHGPCSLHKMNHLPMTNYRFTMSLDGTWRVEGDRYIYTGPCLLEVQSRVNGEIVYFPAEEQVRMVSVTLPPRATVAPDVSLDYANSDVPTISEPEEDQSEGSHAPVSPGA